MEGFAVGRDGALESTGGADGNMVGVRLGGNVDGLQKKKGGLCRAGRGDLVTMYTNCSADRGAFFLFFFLSFFFLLTWQRGGEVVLEKGPGDS